VLKLEVPVHLNAPIRGKVAFNNEAIDFIQDVRVKNFAGCIRNNMAANPAINSKACNSK